MNICFLSELFYPYLLGGAEKRYFEIAKRVAKKNNVTVYSLNFKGYPKIEIKNNIQVVRVGLEHPLNKRGLTVLISYLPALLKSMSHKFDIIDANQGFASFVGIFKKLKLTKRPIIATFHDIYWNSWGSSFKFPYGCVGKILELLWSKMSYDVVIANSPKTKKKLERLGFKSKIVVIPTGVDIEHINKVKVKKQNSTIVYVGRLVGYKNIDLLIKSVATLKNKIPDIKLRIVGSGPEKTNLQRLAESLKVDTKFYGYVTEEEKIKLIKSSTVLVNPSSTEGLGLILIESLACSTPVVARNLDCYYFLNKTNSALYNSQKQMNIVLEKALMDSQYRTKLIKSGYKTASRFSIENTVKKYLEVIEHAR